MKKTSHLIFPVLMLLSPSVFAHGAHHHKAATEAEAAKTAPQVLKGRGAVDKVDAAAGVVILTRDSFKGLGWPDMAMEYTVKDQAMLDNIKAGMKVDFELTRESGGAFVMTRIAPAD
ncbi:MAG: copper-binding protein [Pseudomonadota bacterium]|nr:copper-binding protein [Gammaproteobacteria bacterium]